jgi:hypothetical protein
MKILAISINDKVSQTVFYEDNEGREQTCTTPIIGEDGLLLKWMEVNMEPTADKIEVTVACTPEVVIVEPEAVEVKEEEVQVEAEPIPVQEVYAVSEPVRQKKKRNSHE